MPLPYRTAFSFPTGTDVVALAMRQVQEWIESKQKVDHARRGGFVSGEFFTEGIHDLGSGRELLVVRADGEKEGVRRCLLRFTEATKSGVWQVDIVAVDREGMQRNGLHALLIEATRVDQPHAAGQVDPPQVVKQLLAEREVVDSETHVTSQARLVQPADVGAVLTSITDRDRTVSVIVAAALDHDPVSLVNLRKVVDSLTSKVVGTASVYVMTMEAVALLNESLPAGHRVEPGRVRTYMPQVDLEDTADAWRHRVLGPLTLARAIGRGQRVNRHLQEAFAEQSRGAQLKAPLTRDLSRNLAVLTTRLAELRREHRVRAVVEEQREQIPGHIGGETLRDRLRGLVRKVLDISVRDVNATHVDGIEAKWAGAEAASTALRVDLERAESALERLREERDTLYEEFEYRGLELADSERRASSLDNEVRRLRRELASLGSPSAYTPSIDQRWEAPNDLDELALLLTAEVTDREWLVEKVEFVGELKDVAAARAQDATGLDAQRTWDFVHVLFDYAEAREAGTAPGNVHTCLRSAAYDGFKVPESRHAPGETEQTLNQWAAHRTFRIPGQGDTLMPAHFKSGKFIRLHYHDDTGPGRSGKVFVGYIGLHLPNTKTKSM